MTTRLSDAVLHHGEGEGFDGARYAPMLDPRYGSQMGEATNYVELCSSQVHLRRNLNIVVLKAPEWFNRTTNPAYYIGVLKNLFELMPVSVDGFNQTVEYEFQNTPFGRAGDIIEFPSHATRQVSSPTLRVPERYNKPIGEFLRFWGSWCILDPDAGVPLITTAGLADIDDTLMDNRAATILAYEPDPTNQFPVEAWIGFNIMPKTQGEIIGRREINAGLETVVYDIPFTMTQQVGAGAKKLAQMIMNSIDITGANPMTRAPGITGIDARVASLDTGLINNIEQLKASQI